MEYLVIDIGGSFIKYALINEKCEFDFKETIVTPQDGREQLIEVIGKLYDKFQNRTSGIAIAMPGIIDSDRGYCYSGGALHYNEDFHIRDSLEKRCNTTIHIENDGKCAAMAEAFVGSLKDVNDGVVLVLGTLIGGGIIKNHTLQKGKHFSAGEVTFINTDGKQLPNDENIWGRRCGAPGLCKRVAKKKQLPEGAIDGNRVFQLLEDGDQEVIECMDEYTREIAIQIFNLQNILDPERFAIGGGISAQPLLLKYIHKNLDEIYNSFPYPMTKAEVVTCQFRSDSNLIGALQCYLEAERN